MCFTNDLQPITGVELLSESRGFNKLIWILTFESKYVRKYGGLGEVPPSIARELNKMGARAIVITPSHGRVIELESMGLAKAISSTRVRGVEVRVYSCEELNPPHVVISGGALDEPTIYTQNMWDKIYLYTFGVVEYAKHSIKVGRAPDVVHCNDWHSIPPLTALKLLFNSLDLYPAFVYHIHLLSKESISLEKLEEILIPRERVLKINYMGNRLEVKLEDLVNLSHGYIERFAALIADYVVSVSRSFAFHVEGVVGVDLSYKIGYVYNATDWNYVELVNEVSKTYPELKHQVTGDLIIDRGVFREFLELKALELLSSDEPIIPDPEVSTALANYSTYPFKPGGRVSSFKATGPLALMTGRLVEQKGYDLVIRSLEDVVYRVPEIRLLLIPIPSSGWRGLKPLVEASLLFSNNLRVIAGYTRALYKLAYLASDVFIAPSRFEPFGIVALEAMASGTPVIASRTGGLAEVVMDIREHGVSGTGVLIAPNSVSELASALSDMALFMESSHYKQHTKQWWEIVERISDDSLRNLVLKNPNAPLEVRASCLRRAGEFTWEKTAAAVIKVYSEAIERARAYSG
ncbi:MAG: glycosyltransferase [Desulfurococcaceae archaeon]|nr:glycosyltransferase [Sulfolobales archaeon]MDW8170701.1 glycosyltransferase [Desulfurococcaceae archaeon]